MTEKEFGKLTLFDFETYKTTVVKAVWSWPQHSQAEQWNRIDSSDMEPIHMDNWFSTSMQRWFNGEKDSLFNKWY